MAAAFLFLIKSSIFFWINKYWCINTSCMREILTTNKMHDCHHHHVTVEVEHWKRCCSSSENDFLVVLLLATSPQLWLIIIIVLLAKHKLHSLATLLLCFGFSSVVTTRPFCIHRRMRTTKEKLSLPSSSSKNFVILFFHVLLLLSSSSFNTVS